MPRNCCVALPRGAMDLSAVCDCGISWSYSLTIFAVAPILCWGLVLGHCFVLHYFNRVLSSFSIIWLGKRELVALQLLCSECHVADIDLWLFLAVPLVGLLYVIVAFPGHTHLLSPYVFLIITCFMMHSLFFYSSIFMRKFILFVSRESLFYFWFVDTQSYHSLQI